MSEKYILKRRKEEKREIKEKQTEEKEEMKKETNFKEQDLEHTARTAEFDKARKKTKRSAEISDNMQGAEDIVQA